MRRGKAVARPDPEALAAVRANWKLTQPLGCAVRGILLLAADLVPGALLLLPAEQNVSVFEFGSFTACADVPLNGLTEAGGGNMLAHIKPQAYASADGRLSVCVNPPTTRMSDDLAGTV